MKSNFYLLCAMIFFSSACFSSEMLISCRYYSEYGESKEVFKVDEINSDVTTDSGMHFTISGSPCGSSCGGAAINYVTNIDSDEIKLTTEFTKLDSEVVIIISRITGDFSKYNSRDGSTYHGNCTKVERRF